MSGSMFPPFGRTTKEVSLVTAPGGEQVSRPNVIVILLDDLGFAQLGCFGSDVDTPAIDRLAAEGLRYNAFHVTSICSSTRAALLTGQNHHAVGMGALPDVPMRFPGYSGRIPPTAATMARVLRDAGYSTMAVGKWHLTPSSDRSAAGPFDLWPLGLGFERFYGFLHGYTNQWTPNLVCDNHFVDPPRRPQDGYHLTEDLIDQAIRQLLDQRHSSSSRPFFLYLATGAMHSPHQAPTEWLERYRGRFDIGWERWRAQAFERQRALGIIPLETTCTPRPSWVQEWDALPTEQRRLFARMQEIYAGFLSHTDDQIGRLLDFLDVSGLAENTAVFLMSDNGASAEGGPIGSTNTSRWRLDAETVEENLAKEPALGGFRLLNHYPWGWAWAGNSPFRLWKRYTWLGGTRVPLVVRWPDGIAAHGEIRGQFCHAVDVMPTILELCTVAVPDVVDGVTQRPLDGASFLDTFRDASAQAPRTAQYFEMLGSRAIYVNGWKATTDRVLVGLADERRLIPGSHDIETDSWSLFCLDDDFSEAHDRAEERPDILRQLESLWWAEAGRNSVLPMGDWMGGVADVMTVSPPDALRHKVFLPGSGPIAAEAMPSIESGGRIEVDIDAPADGGDGVLWAQGEWTGGWALLVHSGRPQFVLNAFGADVFRMTAPDRLVPGHHSITVTYEPAPRSSIAALAVDGSVVASISLPPGPLVPSPRAAVAGPLRIGYDSEFPVSDDYRPPFAWSGTIRRLIIESSPPPADASQILDIALHAD
ncbi:MAG: arylsulfatase [Actinomycetota bacterium]|nr:arylsulfatase [Actinomycetota bacterium]